MWGGGLGKKGERRESATARHTPTRSSFPSLSLVFELDQEDSAFFPRDGAPELSHPLIMGLPRFPVVVKLLPDTSSVIVPLWLCSFEPATYPSRYFLTWSEQF